MAQLSIEPRLKAREAGSRAHALLAPTEGPGEGGRVLVLVTSVGLENH